MNHNPLSQPVKRHTIRQQMRKFRRALSPRQQHQAGLDLKKNLAKQPLFIRSERIAFYLANDGEINPSPLLDLALSLGKKCYLPVLAPGVNKAIWFIRYKHNTPMQRNRYGIAEPKINLSQRLKAPQLDLVLMPLVAFDKEGGRLGMGGGYYDRCFAFKQRSQQHNPYLLGLAHNGQQSCDLPLESWDIPLACIATDEKLVICSKTSSCRDFKISVRNRR